MPGRRDSLDQIRRFNRHYVPLMRLLDRSYLDTGLSTLEAAALIEIGENDGCSARDISRLLHMDKGYLSRAISRFEGRGLVERTPSPEDARLQLLSLTDAGRTYVAELGVAGEDIVGKVFAGATDAQLEEVASSLAHVLEILEKGGTHEQGKADR